MTIHIFGTTIISDQKLAALKAAASAAGHDLVTAEGNAVAALWQETKTKYPDLVAAMKKGIADLTDSTLSGGDRAVKVAEDALAIAPAVIAALPSAKDFLVHGVTELFTETKDALVAEAAKLLGTL